MWEVIICNYISDMIMSSNELVLYINMFETKMVEWHIEQMRQHCNNEYPMFSNFGRFENFFAIKWLKQCQTNQTCIQHFSGNKDTKLAFKFN